MRISDWSSDVCSSDLRDEQARALLDAMGIPGTVKSIADASLEGMDVLLNASPLGMTGKPPLALSPAAMNRNAIIFDMVYAPLETPLLRQSRSLGFEAVDGLQMLVAQAAGDRKSTRLNSSH